MGASAETGARPEKVERAEAIVVRPEHAGRVSSRPFLLAYAGLGLALVAVGAITLWYAVLRHPPRPWSSWRPAATGLAGATQIADRVAAAYRRVEGPQPVTVVAHPPTIQNVPFRAVAIRQPGSGNVSLLSTSREILYVLCGKGSSCTLGTSLGSPARDRLFRRESLELALYTFEYERVDAVVAVLPPLRGGTPSRALLFRRGDLSAELRRPLEDTLPGPVTAPKSEPIDDRVAVDRLTLPRLHRLSLVRTEDDAALLVLRPPGSS